MQKIVFFLLLFPLILFSQETTPKKLKVGLVLSGGGAKGLAHVGVLKVLEKSGVQIDYVGGTSMGAIIGSLYASGYSATQIDSIVHTFDFNEVMKDEFPRKSKPYYEKVNGEKYAISLPIHKRKVGLPKALSSGQRVFDLLTKLTRHVHHIHDFSKLPIPFYCLATNLETGKPVLLNKGFLPEAVRMSGAFPTLLEPVEYDGMLLSDGGIVNNFPIDEMIAMGADIIIGVDVQGDLSKKEDLNSAVDIVNQIVSFQMYKDNKEKNEKVHLYMHPDIYNYSVVSFDKLDEIIEKGEVAANELQTSFTALANKQRQLGIQQKKQHVALQYSGKRLVNSIGISGNKDYTRAYIMGKLNIKTNDSISYESFIEGINNLSATGNFQSILHQFNKHQISLRLKENPITSQFKISPHYDDLYKTAVLLNFTTKHILSKNDILSTDLVVGDNIRYQLNYFIDNGFYWSYGIHSTYNAFNATMSFDAAATNKDKVDYQDLSNQIYFQTVFGRRYALGVGLEHKLLRVFTKTVSITNNEIKNYLDKSNYLNFISYLKIDTYDKPYFQTSGVLVDVNFRWYLLSSNYRNDFYSFSQLQGKVGYAHSFSNKLTALFTTSAGFTIGVNNNPVLDYSLGGFGGNYIANFIPLHGYDIADLNNSSFLKSTFDIRYEIFNKNYLEAGVHVARSTNDIYNQGKIFDNTKYGLALGYGLETFIGPVQFHYTWSPDVNKNWYFNIGFWF